MGSKWKCRIKWYQNPRVEHQRVQEIRDPSKSADLSG
jgi:hypothetical protein